MSIFSRQRPAPGLRLLAPLTTLGAAVALAFALHPHVSTVLLMLALIALGAGRSMLRAGPWGSADDVTTLRLGIIMIFTALVIPGAGFSWTAVGVAASALALDACDGYVARRTTTTAAGADFDEAVDALVILILSVALIPLWGWWTILPGSFHYLFRAVALLRTAWQRRLPPSMLRKTIAAGQGALLVTAGSPIAVEFEWIGVACVATALVTLTFSFGRDVLWLERNADSRVSVSAA